MIRDSRQLMEDGQRMARAMFAVEASGIGTKRERRNGLRASRLYDAFFADTKLYPPDVARVAIDMADETLRDARARVVLEN